MSAMLIYGIGLLAQLLFSSRLLHQWIVSEKANKVITPVLFWTLSLVASFLLFIYGYLRDDITIMLGQVLSYFIYIRNLQLQGQWTKVPLVLRISFLVTPLMVIYYLFNNNVIDIQNLMSDATMPRWCLILGLVAQFIFSTRFIYQWIKSEQQKESYFPLGFWVLSAVGSLLILIYAVIRRDPILFLGHIVGIVAYVRNIMLYKKIT